MDLKKGGPLSNTDSKLLTATKEVDAMDYTGKTFSLDIAGMKTAFLVKKIENNKALVLDITGKDTKISMKYMEEWLRDGYMKRTQNLRIAASAEQSVYIGWYEVVLEYVHVRAALWVWKSDSADQDFKKASAYVEEQHGDHGLVLLISSFIDSEKAKDTVRKAVSVIAKKKHPNSKIVLK